MVKNNAHIDVWSSSVATYDTLRPVPPTILVGILTQLVGMLRPHIVVDIGCGTGISTRLWAERAELVIGIEPNAEMRHQAELSTANISIRYQDGLSIATGLPDACADIVTIAQALHWMEPEPTFAEVSRILRPGGIFAAYDCDWPPTMNVNAERAYYALMDRLLFIERVQLLRAKLHPWKGSEHVARMVQSKQFSFVKEFFVHSIESGDAERFVTLALTSPIWLLAQNTVTADEIGFDRFRIAVHTVLGDKPVPWFLSYRVQVAMK